MRRLRARFTAAMLATAALGMGAASFEAGPGQRETALVEALVYLRYGHVFQWLLPDEPGDRDAIDRKPRR